MLQPKRYELSEAQWARVAPMLPGKAADPGRTGGDNRLFVNGCLGVLRAGPHCRALPERDGKWKTPHQRFTRAAQARAEEAAAAAPAQRATSHH